MGQHRVVLAKQINGQIEYLYPKTYADQIIFSDTDTTTVKTKIDGILGNIANLITADTNMQKAIDEKVDKITGKGLSTNDYTNDEKTKLAGIAAGANKTVVDTELKSDSTNPVQNKVIAAAIAELADDPDVYVQNDEPTDAEDGSIWIDLDGEESIGLNNKIDMPTDETGTILKGSEGQVLQANGDGTTSWVDYVPAAVATIDLKGGIDNWTEYPVEGSTATRYGQVVTVKNATITPNSSVDLRIDSEQVAIFHEKCLAFVAENEDGIVTVFCVGQIPQNDYTIQVKVTEVA